MKQFISLCLMLCFTAVTLSAADIKPVEIKKEDKCPVCGMFVAKYRPWIAQIIFKDGSYAVFDGPKDMFKYYLNQDRYAPSKKSSDISAIFVTEYYSTKIMDAKKLFFVSGSNVYGPMGDEFIPFVTEAEAKEFMRDHKGKKILKFQEINSESLK